MEKGNTYTENELEEKAHLEEEIRFILNLDYISNVSVTVGNMLIKRWKQLVEWKEDDTPPHETT